MNNQAFSSFPLETQQQLLRAGHKVNLPVGKSLYQMGYNLTSIYFLSEGMASIVVEVEDGESVEAGMIGDEGIVGVTALLGSSMMRRHCFMQIAGAGLQVPLTVLQNFFDADHRVRSVVHAFLTSQLLIAEQVTACNRLHTMDTRLARWILTASDRVHSDQVNLTQEFLGQMLGTMRTTVAIVAGDLQRAKVIEYSRGRIKIVNRAALTKMACDCYPIIRDAAIVPPQTPTLSAA